MAISPLGSVVADTVGRFALVIDSLAEEEHALTTIATDAAGNTSEASHHSFSVDNTAPTVTLTSPNGGEKLRGSNSIDIIWQPATDTYLTNNPISLFYSLTDLDGWIPIALDQPNDGNYTWTIPPVNSQSIRMKVTAVDVAGNIGEDESDADCMIDSEAPTSVLTIISPSKEQTQYLRGGSTYTILWALPQDNFALADVFLCYSVDGGGYSLIAQVMAGQSPPLPVYGRYDWEVPEIDSNPAFPVIVRIEATDVSGNMSYDMSGNHVIDSSAPDAPGLTPMASPTAQNVLTITGTAEAFSPVSLRRDDNPIASIPADASGNFSFTTAPLADGLHSFTATATDVAGNISSASVPMDVIVDTLAPNQPIILSPEPGTIFSGTAITISGTVEFVSHEGIHPFETETPESRVDIYDNDQIIGFAITDASGVFELANQVFDEGEHILTAIATDDAGNASEVSESVTLIVVDFVLIAQFTWAPEPQDEGAPVQFTNTSTSSPDEIVSFSWDFGDSNTSSEENPSHPYGDNGTYTVTLTVGASGGATDTISHDVEVNNVAPVVEAGSDRTADKGYEIVCNATFTDQGWLDTHTTTIDWGDEMVDTGSVSEDMGSGTVTGSHAYNYYGCYTVTIEVTDDDGASASDVFKVVVLPAAFNYVLFGNSGNLVIKKQVTVSGDVFNNGKVEVLKDANINGLLFCTGRVTGQGTYTLGELPDPLPAMPSLDTIPYDVKLSEAAFQPEGDLVTDGINLSGETVLVNGKVVLTEGGNIMGPGVIVATEGIQIKEDSAISENAILIAGGKIELKERVSATNLDNTFFSANQIEIEKEGQIAGALLSKGNVEIEENTIFSGILYANGTVNIDKETNVEGCVVANKLNQVEESALISYNEAITQELFTKIFIEGVVPAPLPVSPAAFNYALFGNNGNLSIKKQVTVSGDVFNNGDVGILKDANIDGLLFCTGKVTGKGTYTLGDLPDPLPALPFLDTTPYDVKLSEASLQPKGDLVTDSINLSGGTILINGKVVLTEGGNIIGPGVIVATGKIQIEEDSVIGEDVILVSDGMIELKKRVVSAASLDNTFFSTQYIEIEKETQISGALLSLGDVYLKQHTTFSGIVYATGLVCIDDQSIIEGSVVANRINQVWDGTSVTYNQTIAEELFTKIFVEGEELGLAPAISGLRKFIQRESKLAQNYPNPFNPETWIPYQLAEETEVIIHIYNISGQLIRTLNLGYQNAGNYLGKGEAAYWDGRNSSGQKVASGLYFYTLQAGEFKATRRMVIMK